MEKERSRHVLRRSKCNTSYCKPINFLAEICSLTVVRRYEYQTEEQTSESTKAFRKLSCNFVNIEVNIRLYKK